MANAIGPETSDKPKVVVLIDPYHEYGAYFIQAIFSRWGLQTVCLYTDKKQLRMHAYRYPELVGDMVLANHLVSPDELATLAGPLAKRYEVAAVVPHVETAVLPASELAAALELSWGADNVLARFRDKFALKSHLRDVPDGPRVNAIALVRDVQDVRIELDKSSYDRFVIKPNDGFGNTGVGFFDRSTPLEQIAEFITESGAGKLIMEEFVEGAEFVVKGQVDGDGNIMIFEVSKEEHVGANGRENVQSASVVLPRQDPRFNQLADYATAAVAASGLRRSPFHADLLLDSHGPCLIEVGARLVGADGSPDLNHIHGDKIDVFQIAAHYYLTDEPYGPVDLDWETYDGFDHRKVVGISTGAGWAFAVDGVDRVEAMSQFWRWSKAPKVGDQIHATTDLVSMAWLVSIRSADLAEGIIVEQQIRDRIVLHLTGGPDKPTLRQRIAMAAVVGKKLAVAAQYSRRLKLSALN